MPAQTSGGRILIAVAHPDDEYACAATTYRLVRELGWVADQVVITNGEGGYRYSALAETVYGKPLSSARDNLIAIRKEETLRAGTILGIRHHTFLDQKDLGFASDPATADAGYWDRAKVVESLRSILSRGDYDVVFALLPTAATHAHHRAAALLTLEAAAKLGEEQRPLILGVEARSRAWDPLLYEDAAPVLEFDRTASFGYHGTLDYQIVVNWLIAEYKSQGLFQKDCGKHDVEQFWELSRSSRATRTLAALQAHLRVPVNSNAAR